MARISNKGQERRHRVEENSVCSKVWREVGETARFFFFYSFYGFYITCSKVNNKIPKQILAWENPQCRPVE